MILRARIKALRLKITVQSPVKKKEGKTKEEEEKREKILHIYV